MTPEEAERTVFMLAIRYAKNEALEQAAEIAEAIDSERGNEKEIARAIRNLKDTP